MDPIPSPAIALRCIIAQHGLQAVLDALAKVMGEDGNITSGIVGQVAAIEGWLGQT